MWLLWRNPLHLSPWLCSPQSKTLEELSEIYASAVDAQEIAATSSDPVLARERLQSMLWDIAGAASFPAITGERPPQAPLPSRVFCWLSPHSKEWLYTKFRHSATPTANTHQSHLHVTSRG